MVSRLVPRSRPLVGATLGLQRGVGAPALRSTWRRGGTTGAWQAGGSHQGVAVVTGGGGGIGSGIAGRLAREGMRVVLTYRSDEAKARAVAQALAGSGHLVLPADVGDSSSLKELADRVEQAFGGVDLLVNNAGATTGVPHGDLDGLTDEWIDRIFATNFRGSFACVRAFRPLLEAHEGGTVVSISSISGVTGIGSNVAYCASKAAIDSMTRSLGRALAPKIRVLSVSPGWVPGEYAKNTVSPDFLQAEIDATPLARLGTPADVGAAVWAAHAHLSMSTGCIVPVDGGRPLRTK